MISRAYAQNMAGFPAALQAWDAHLHVVTNNALQREDKQASTLALNLGYYLDMNGDYAAAHPLYERALAIYEQTLGSEHPNTKIVRDNLASLNA